MAPSTVFFPSVESGGGIRYTVFQFKLSIPSVTEIESFVFLERER